MQWSKMAQISATIAYVSIANQTPFFYKIHLLSIHRFHVSSTAPFVVLSTIATMATTGELSLFSVFLVFLCLFHGCFSQQPQQQRGQCQIQRLNPQEPRGKIQAEAGVTEFWDHNDVQFQCAGVSMLRHVIQSRGFLLPSYTNAPLLAYVAQGIMQYQSSLYFFI